MDNTTTTATIHHRSGGRNLYICNYMHLTVRDSSLTFVVYRQEPGFM
jgi:hypothetical protein